MSQALCKKSILRKTLQVGNLTLLSRFFGVIREVLMVRYLGAGAVSDAFFTAWKIPNSLRKIFAEGALSAAFIPTLVTIVKKDRRDAAGLMTAAFLFFEGCVLLLCGLVIYYAPTVIQTIAPGFSEQQVAIAVPFVRILMPFIFFISSSALLAGALQSVGHFFVPAFSPVLLNIVFISALLICKKFNLPIEVLCYFILCGGALQFAVHIIQFIRLRFSFGSLSPDTLVYFKQVLKKFFPCLIGMSVLEFSLFIDTSFASWLKPGSISLLRYANRFMGIPLGVFAVAFSTILLPHFSRVSAYAPKRLSYYLLEATKFILWVMIPVSIMMGFFAEKVFHTIFLSSKFTLAQVHEASHILIAFLIGLCCFSLNKILLNLFYSLHETFLPTVISIVATAVNIMFNYLLIGPYKATGLALATTIGNGILQTLLFIFFLHYKFNFVFYGKRFLYFITHYMAQLLVVFTGFMIAYHSVEILINMLPAQIASLLLYKIWFWFWAGPLALCAFAVLFFSRRMFNVQLYFLD